MLDWNDLLLTQPSALDSESTQQAYQDCTTISRTRFWPVVDHGRYTGLMGPDGHVLSAPSLKVEQHPLDALAIASAWQVDCVAVCNKEVFEGVYVTASLAERIGQQWSFQLPGSSIWFEHPVDQPFSGTWIRGIEAEGLRVVAFSSDFSPEHNIFRSFARLDQPDPTVALATLERFGCTIVGYYPRGQRADQVEENLEHLLHYLNF